MKQFNELQTKIIHQLKDRDWHSGNQLGNILKVSRTTLWKHVNLLYDLGIRIERNPKQGYRLLTPLILLNEQAIRKQLTMEKIKHLLLFHLYVSIDSTNRFLKTLPQNTFINICCAEKQTEGRGRFGRSWHSPFGENIYCSSRWHLNTDLSQLGELSLVISLAVLAMLKELGIYEHIKVKWPNDILWHDKKICGILIEILAETNGHTDLIIGIGLNVNSNFNPPSQETQPKKPDHKLWGSLHEITNTYYDRNLLIALLIQQLDQHMKKLIQHGFNYFIKEWHPIDYLYNKIITITHNTGSIIGKASGINETGQLKLMDEQGKMHYLSTGDTSLHEKTAIKQEEIS